MQLPDIIKKKEGLGEKMKEGMEKGQSLVMVKRGKLVRVLRKRVLQDGRGGRRRKSFIRNSKEQKQLREALENELNKARFRIVVKMLWTDETNRKAIIEQRL
jgi:hypothetical protein